MTADPTPTTWATWVREQLDHRRWRAADLTRASGGRYPSGTISRWLKGDLGVSSDVAITVAELFGADPVSAVRAAGLARTAAELEARRAESAPPPPPADPYLEKLQAKPNLTRRQKELIANQYRLARSAFDEQMDAMERAVELAADTGEEVETSDMAPEVRHGVSPGGMT